MHEPTPTSDQNSPPDMDVDEELWENELETCPSKTRRRLFLAISLVLGIPFLLFVGILGLGLLFAYGAKEIPLSASDRTVVLRAEALAEWIDGFTPDANHESLIKLRNIDGSIAIEYEYDDSANEDAPYLFCSVDYDRSVSDARINLGAAWIGAKGGVSLLTDGVTVEEDNEIFSWGDHSHYGTLQYEGVPSGHLIACQKGKMVFFISLGGIYFEDPESLKDLLIGILERAALHDPR